LWKISEPIAFVSEERGLFANYGGVGDVILRFVASQAIDDFDEKGGIKESLQNAWQKGHYKCESDNLGEQ